MIKKYAANNFVIRNSIIDEYQAVNLYKYDIFLNNFGGCIAGQFLKILILF